MEESVIHTVKRLKNWFLVILMVPFALVLSYSLTGSGTFHRNWKISNLNQYQLTVVLKDNRRIDVTEKTPVEPLHVYSTTGHEDRKTSAQQNTSVITTAKDATTSASMTHIKRGNFTGVILLTYMRSGSSLTGDILQQPKDTFYLFEPLKSAEHIQKRNGSISYLNGTVMTNGRYNLSAVYLDTLLGWLTCNFSRVYLESLLDLEFLAFGKTLQQYTSCIYRAGLGDFPETSKPILYNITIHQKELLKTCMEDLRNVCLRSKYRIVKTIRTKMSLAAQVLEQVVDSKLIHLVRDPRATIESKSHRKVCPLGLSFCISQHCQRVRDDIIVEKKSRSPERFHTVFYENIASRPIQTAKMMYKFIGMELTPVISDYIFNITLGKNKSGCSVCTAKWQIGNSASSSEKHVDAWKQKLPPKYINRTQQLCNDVIKHYGYEYYVAPYRRKSKNKKVLMKKVIQSVGKFQRKVS
ncbi:carbohydrate sulfotransferase 6-like [Mercenaria mercenaria]|uniref:carbohydrate sulfotransferase 6-like n=1 Tax=Mercenaria mercenaria TaxID=6596 RepID=UPI00234F9299|nr:carbohydrate sulfotransferase 6-like [Mercenaria mercenaria]XP_045165006.2 carbohydrate sulfotransferase 6-like [Mercenaria mercenaria]XP_045165008.2 carbohydrate sulfotransferase 6-like [Mercenaria mercenaria]XP_045165009.2 carbohydrate sulfotransferase 6-like [Mercenaria mercenaria]XP_053377445.1 carbohydrate sulfotransferase 6-like [Mercenaria mercenaria]XP_053377446.1 carbohydrate sulfotransferase 6-like [Mercenaria mercenaria]XP_053377447.1 carbohydrate sulfotransferase 6-like [Mercen